MEQSEIEEEIIAEKKSISNIYRFLLIFLFTVAAAFAVFYYTNKKSTSRIMVDASVFEARLQNLENSIPLHEKRLAKLEEGGIKPAKAQEDKPAPTPVEAAVAPETKIPEALTQQIDALEKEIKGLKVTSGSNKHDVFQAIKILSAFNRLNRMITLGKPFSAELSAFLEVYGAENDKAFNDTIETLTPYSDSGIPVQSALSDSFDDAVKATEGAQATLPENAGFWQSIFFNITHLVSIRKVDRTMTGNSTDAVIGRAADYLDNEENEAAIAEIKTLPDAVKNNFNAWLEQTQMVAIVPSLLDDLNEKVMKKAFEIKDLETEDQKLEN